MGIHSIKCQDLLALLEELLALLEQEAEQKHYGVPFVSDPRDYEPDWEECTPEEIEQWREACRRAEAGEEVDPPLGWELDEETGALYHTFPWGVGVSVTRDPKKVTLRDKVAAMVEKLKKECQQGGLRRNRARPPHLKVIKGKGFDAPEEELDPDLTCPWP